MKYKGSYLSYILTYFFFFFSMSIISSILSVYLTGIGKSPQEMSLIVSSSSLFSLIFLPLTGLLNDKLKRPRILNVLFLLLSGVLGLVFSQLSDVLLLFLFNGLIMLGINSVMAVCERMAGSSKHRYGAIRVWGTLGYASGAQVAGFAIEHISPSFIFVFLFLSLLVTIVGFLGTDAGSHELKTNSNVVESLEIEKNQKKSIKSEKPQFLRDKSFLLFLLIAFVFTGASSTNMTYIPVLLTEMGISTTAVGTVIFLSTIVEIPLILYSNKFMDKLSSKTLLCLSFSILLVQFLSYGLIKTPFLVITIIIMLKAVASSLFMMTNLKLVRNIVSKDYTVTALSIIGAVNSLGAILLQNLSGFIVQKSSIPTLFLALSALVVIGILLSAFLTTGNDEKVFE